MVKHTQTIHRQQPTNCFSVFDHFSGLARKGLTANYRFEVGRKKHEIYILNTLNPFQPSVAFHIETRHLICSVNQITGFCMQQNTGLKWVIRFTKRHQRDVKCRRSIVFIVNTEYTGIIIYFLYLRFLKFVWPFGDVEYYSVKNVLWNGHFLSLFSSTHFCIIRKCKKIRYFLMLLGDIFIDQWFKMV